MTKPDCFDVLIVGGGMVGASLACALGNRSIKVGLIEAVPWGVQAQPSFDDRSVALSFGSKQIFSALGLWPAIEPSVTPIKEIHVSDSGHFGVTRISAAEENVDGLGYVVENRSLGAALLQHLKHYSNVSFFCPAEVSAISVTDSSATVAIRTEQAMSSLTAKLVVAADGGNSLIRQLIAAKVTRHEYRQSAIISNISPVLPHRNIAFERFTKNGPLALLPMTHNRYSLVWTLPLAEADRLKNIEDKQFAYELRRTFGFRVGPINKVGIRKAYNLSLIRAQECVQSRVALIGNAAHTLHPVAGQGLNLGLGDVAVLAEIIVDATKCGQDPGSLELLNKYAQWRRDDHDRAIQLTDSLVRIFSTPFLPLALTRNLGMLAIDMLRPLKRPFVRQTMGLSGKLPRLARGLAL